MVCNRGVIPKTRNILVAFRRLVYTNGGRGSEDKDEICVRDIEMITACTDEEILDEYGVAP